MGWQHYTYTNTHIHWRRIAAYPREVRSRAAPHYIHFMQLLMLRDALVCCLINLTPPALYTVLCVSPVLLSCCAAESVKLLSLHSSRIQLGLRVGAILRVVCSQSDTARGWIMYQKLNCHCGDDFICHHKGRQQQGYTKYRVWCADDLSKSIARSMRAIRIWCDSTSATHSTWL